MQGMKFFFDEADGSLCPPICLWYLDTWFFHLYLWWDAFFPCEWSESRFFFKISIYPLKNLTGETFSLIFLLNGKIALTEKLQYFLIL